MKARPTRILGSDSRATFFAHLPLLAHAAHVISLSKSVLQAYHRLPSSCIWGLDRLSKGTATRSSLVLRPARLCSLCLAYGSMGQPCWRLKAMSMAGQVLRDEMTSTAAAANYRSSTSRAPRIIIAQAHTMKHHLKASLQQHRMLFHLDSRPRPYKQSCIRVRFATLRQWN